MKPEELKEQFIELRAEGKSYSTISKELHISKSTCTKWEQDFSEAIAKLKADQLNGLYEQFYMSKAARIKKLGTTLQKIDTALDSIDLKSVEPSKLLDFKLKYTEALKAEYIATTSGIKLDKDSSPSDIVAAFGDLLHRVQSGEVGDDQANRESTVLGNLLKAYELTEVNTKLEAMQDILGGRTQ